MGRCLLWLAAGSLILLSAIGIVSQVFGTSVAEGYDCWTDRDQYKIGEQVKVYVQIPPVYTLGPYSLVVHSPDGSRATLYSGELKPANAYPFTGDAGYPAGQRRVELSGFGELLAYCYFTVIGGPSGQEIRFVGTAIEYFSLIGGWGWYVRVEDFISSIARHLALELRGQTVTVYLAAVDPEQYPLGYMDPSISSGDKVLSLIHISEPTRPY